MNRNKALITKTSEQLAIYRLFSGITTGSTSYKLSFWIAFHSTWETYFTSLDHQPEKSHQLRKEAKYNRKMHTLEGIKDIQSLFKQKECWNLFLWCWHSLRALLTEDLLLSEMQGFWNVSLFFMRPLEENCLSPAGITNSLDVFFWQKRQTPSRSHFPFWLNQLIFSVVALPAV